METRCVREGKTAQGLERKMSKDERERETLWKLLEIMEDLTGGGPSASGGATIGSLRDPPLLLGEHDILGPVYGVGFDGNTISGTDVPGGPNGYVEYVEAGRAMHRALEEMISVPRVPRAIFEMVVSNMKVDNIALTKERDELRTGLEEARELILKLKDRLVEQDVVIGKLAVSNSSGKLHLC